MEAAVCALPAGTKFSAASRWESIVAAAMHQVAARGEPLQPRLRIQIFLLLHKTLLYRQRPFFPANNKRETLFKFIPLGIHIMKKNGRESTILFRIAQF